MKEEKKKGQFFRFHRAPKRVKLFLSLSAFSEHRATQFRCWRYNITVPYEVALHLPTLGGIGVGLCSKGALLLLLLFLTLHSILLLLLEIVINVLLIL
jgi:hypothetical protein